VGRARERALLSHLLAEADNGHAAALVVAGVAGVGKTALLRWLTARAQSGGALVLTATATEDLLPGDIVERIFRPLLPALATSADAGSGSGSGAGAAPPAFDVTDRLIGTGRRRLIVLAVDDAHELQRSAARDLAQVLAAADEAGVDGDLRLLTVVATDEPIEPGGLVDRVLRLDSARSLRLEGLDEDEVFELFQTFGQRPDHATVTRLLEETGGLPLLIGAALDEHARGAGPSLGSSVPQDLRVRAMADALRPSLWAVDPDVIAVLQLAAVLGDPWDPSELALVADHPLADLAPVLDDAVEAGLIVLELDGGRFAHPLVRGQVLRGLPPGEHDRLHRWVAERLATAPPTDELAVRIAVHLARGGVGGRVGRPGNGATAVADTAAAVGLLVRGAEVAWRTSAWAVAGRLFATAAEAEGGLADGDPAVRARHLLAAASAAYFDEDSNECEVRGSAAIAAARAAGLGAVELEAALVLVRNRVAGRAGAAGTAPSVVELERALTNPGLDPAREVAAHASLAEVLFLSGDADRAFALLDHARRLVPAGLTGGPGAGSAPTVRSPRPGTGAVAGDEPDPLDDDPRFRVELVDGLHRLAGVDVDGATACFARARDAAERSGGEWSAITARSRAALVDLLRGFTGRADTELAAVVGRADARRFRGEAAFAAAQRAYLAVLAGRPDAEAVADQALRRYRRSGGDPAVVVLAPATAAWAARRGGEDVVAGSGALAPPFTRSSLCRVLRAVEANDAEGVWGPVVSASWRRGLQGPVTLQNQAIPVALVLAGDLVGEPALVAVGEPPLARLADLGVVVSLGWPALVPRLLAVCARTAGRLDEARLHLDHAGKVAEHEGLAVEAALTILERARWSAAAGGDPAEIRALLTDAVRRLDELALLGWVARAQAIAEDLGVAPLVTDVGAAHDRTILTTDIVGSTELNARLGDVLYVEQLRIHDRLVRRRLRECHGIEIKHTGDGINALFDEPGPALRCALGLQRDLARWREDDRDLAFAVRCGVARGPVIPEGGDYFGLVQSEAARLCALADAGAVLASGPVVDGLPAADAFVLDDLGIRQLRGLPSATAVYRVSSR
jgi:class 3 adenylate cyclase